MRPETEVFLARVRDAEDPTRADEQRVLLALRASLAAGATSSVLAASLEPRRSAELGELGARVFGSLGSKLNVLVVCAAAAFGTADTPRTSTEQAHAAAPQTPPAAARFAAPEPPAPVEPPVPPAPAAQARPASGQRQPLERRTPPASLTPSSSHKPSASLRAELDLLRAVQSALHRGDGAAALRALDGHPTRGRVFLAERQAARVLALCSLGRLSEARRAAATFEREHPGSVQSDVIARSCANPRRIGDPSRH